MPFVTVTLDRQIGHGPGTAREMLVLVQDAVESRLMLYVQYNRKGGADLSLEKLRLAVPGWRIGVIVGRQTPVISLPADKELELTCGKRHHTIRLPLSGSLSCSI